MDVLLLPHKQGVLATLVQHVDRMKFERYKEVCQKYGGRFSADEHGYVFGLSNIYGAYRTFQAKNLLVEFEKSFGTIVQTLNQNVADCSIRIKGSSLFPFQLKGSMWLAASNKRLLSDQMGLGKTVQVLMAYPNEGKCMVICPASLKGVWHDECKRWRPDLTPIVLRGVGGFRLPQKNELIIVNYDIIPEHIEKGEMWKISLAADEAHYLKGNAKVKRVKSFRLMSDEILKNGGSVWLATGTPMLNKPPELWNVLRCARLAEEAFGGWYSFVQLFGGYKGAFGGWEWSIPDRDKVAKNLSPVMLRRLRKDVMPELPTKMYRTITVDIDKEFRAKFDESIKDLNLDQAIEETIANRRSSPEFKKLSEAFKLLTEAKIPRLLELIEMFEDSGEPVIVFSAHVKPIEVLGERKGWMSIKGDTTSNNRMDAVRLFQEGKLKGIALTIGAGGIGLTLTRGHQVIFLDLAWTPTLNEQAEDRAVRIGQTKGVIVTRIIADHVIDRRVVELLSEKQYLIQQTTG
ncbi:MAG: DEAD/DEAH box helicase [Gammaproteobacteria bacterium]|nr:DEAD/DEAH box helicase [Gammaproteobacteria bacterium]